MNRIFLNLNEKYTFDKKLCQTTFLYLIEVNNFAFLRVFRISHIMIKNLNFRFSIVSFEIRKKNIHIIKKMLRFKVIDLIVVKNFVLQLFFVSLIV